MDDRSKSKNWFENYRKLKLEQARLNDRIEYLLSEREKIQSRIILDSVIASDKDYPYISHPSKIEGYTYDSDKIENHIINKELKYVIESQKINDKALSEIRQYVDGIEDEFIKAIVTYRFINGMSWRQVAFRMGGGNTEASVRMAYKRYFKCE